MPRENRLPQSLPTDGDAAADRSEKPANRKTTANDDPPLRVIYTHDIFSRQAAGGISRYFAELIRGMSERAETTVFAGWHHNMHLAESDMPGIWGRHCSRRATHPFFRPLYRLLNRAWQQTAVRIRPSDIVHQTYYSFLPPARSGRLVLTICDMIPERFHRGVRARGLSAAKRLGCSRAARIVAISHNTKQDLCERFSIAEERVDVVPLGVRPELVRTESAGPPRPEPYLLYVGSRAGYKNWNGLVAAFAATPALHENFKLVCFGGGRWTSAEQEYLARLRVARKVELVQGNDRRLIREYASARGLLYPSLFEGFGLPTLEAMACGCPVACSDRGAIPEIVGDAGIYFNPTDADSMAAAIERLAFDESLRIALKPRMKARVAAFSWEQTVAETFESYRRAVA